MYLDGRGVRQDNVEAYKWFKLAADHKNGMGINYLGQMNAKGLLNSNQLAQVQREVAEFASQPHSYNRPVSTN